MAKLEDMRRWLQGEDVEGLPRHKQSAKRGALNNGKMERKNEAKGSRWRSIKGGTDAVLLFGKFRGRKVSEMVKEPDGYSYLEWIMTEDSFPLELRRIINLHMGGGY